MIKAAAFLAAALAALAPVRAAAQQEALPPPPPPPSSESPYPESPAYPTYPAPPPSQQPAPAQVAPPPAQLTPQPVPEPTARPVHRGVIGEGPVAPAGAPAAALHPEEAVSHWRYALASGVNGRWGGMQLSSTRENSTVMLYFGGQADGIWTEGQSYGRAARLRLRLITGGERLVFLPSDGEVEAAFMVGRREFRFVMGRAEVGRYPALGIQVLGQLATLPCFEGSVAFSGDRMRLYYYISPIELAYVYYYGDAHIHHTAAWPTESDRPSAASAFRVRYTALVPPSVLLSLQGDFVRFWGQPDTLVSGEGAMGYAVLDNSVLFNVAIRWDNVTRRGVLPNTEAKSSQVMLLAIATLTF